MKHALLATTLLALPAAAQTPNCKPSKQGFTVTAAGFTDPSGQPWSFRGVNMDVKDAMPMLHGQFFQHFPGTTAIRLAAGAERDRMETLDQIVLYYTGKGVVLEIEDHDKTQNGQNIAWYSQIAQRYKSNALVFGETPNEPEPGMTGAPQAAIINAMRAAGFPNPIGIQPIGGWDQSNIPAVLAGVTSKDNLYVTPHVYCGSDGGPACPTTYANGVAKPNNGLFPVIDEFGDALDGFTRDAYGLQVITAVIDVVTQGKAGGAFWHAGNGFHPDGADSACQQEGCASLSITGNMLKPWLSAKATATPACSMVSQANLPNDTTQATLDGINQQTQKTQAQIAKLQQNLPSASLFSPPPPQPTPQPSAPSFTGYNPQFVQQSQQAQQQLQSLHAKIQNTQTQIQNFDPNAVAASIVAQAQSNPSDAAPLASPPAPPKKHHRDNDGDGDDQ